MKATPMVKWYWILAAFCLVASVGVSYTTWQQSQKRSVEELRTEGMSDAFNERWEEAERKLAVVVKDSTATPDDWFMYGLSLHYQSKYSKAIKTFIAAEGKGYPPYLTQYNIACGYAQTDKPDQAFQHLKKAIDHGFADPVWLKQDPDIEPLRQDPRFEEMIRLIHQLNLEGEDPDA